MRFEIIKADGICGYTNTTDPAIANCVILVDVNGDRGPNMEARNISNMTYSSFDRYLVIVKSESALPASNSTNDAAIRVLNIN